MKDSALLTESFRTKYESFITGCDSLEFDKWDKQEYGEMDIFYENELLSVILSLVIADGKISDDEVRYLNECFGFTYTIDKLKNVYLNCGEEIDNYFDDYFKQGYEMLKTMNAKSAEAYSELFGLICRIIAESDGVVSDDEKERIRSLSLD